MLDQPLKRIPGSSKICMNNTLLNLYTIYIKIMHQQLSENFSQLTEKFMITRLITITIQEYTPALITCGKYKYLQEVIYPVLQQGYLLNAQIPNTFAHRYKRQL